MTQSHHLHGILLNAVNPNGRIYPEVETMASMKRAMGSGRPVLLQTYSETDYGTGLVCADRVCGAVESIDQDGDRVSVTWKPLATPRGAVISSLLGAGVEFAILPCGTGVVNDRNEVVDYTLQSLNLIPANDPVLL